MNPNRKTELLVGLFLFVGLLLLGGLVLQFGSLREMFRDTYTLRVAFPNASGIKEGAPVYLGGSKVGKVIKHPQLNDTFTGAIIDLQIFDDVDIPSDAKFAIGSAGLMGDALIEIKPTGKETKVFLSHDQTAIIDGSKSGGLTDLTSTAEEIGKNANVVLEDIRLAMVDVKGAMAKINKGALADETVTDFKKSIEHLHLTMERVDEKVLGDENTNNLKMAIVEIKDAATAFKNSAKNIEEQTKRLGPMFDKLDPAISKADKVMTAAHDSLKSIKSAADSFAVAARNITSGTGLLGALLNDAELKSEFKDLIYNLKHSGVVFYKNAAEKERAKALEEQQRQQSEPPAREPPSSLFRRR